MFKKIIFLISFLLSLNASVEALSPTDKFISRNVITQQCNGESQNCEDAYGTAVQLNKKDGPGITFD